MPLQDPEVSAKMGTLQMMDDAITYRLSRLNLPCPAGLRPRRPMPRARR